MDAAKEHKVKVKGYTYVRVALFHFPRRLYSDSMLILKHHSVDVASIDSLQEGYAAVEKDFEGQLDIFVGAAGINKVIDFLETDWDWHLKMLSVNQMGLYHSAQLAARMMIKCSTKNGSVILIGGGAGQIAVKSVNTSAYCGSKGGVLGMTPAIAKELGPYVSMSTMLV